jgi:hypothetical protein
LNDLGALIDFATVFLCLIRSAYAGDAAAFENSVASLLHSSASQPPRQNELSFLSALERPIAK